MLGELKIKPRLLQMVPGHVSNPNRNMQGKERNQSSKVHPPSSSNQFKKEKENQRCQSSSGSTDLELGSAHGNMFS